MNWSDERYVRLYTRDTVTWLRWRWETRAVLCLLLRKVDRSGVLDTGALDKTGALALMLGVPSEVAAVAVAELLSGGTLVEGGSGFTLPAFMEAQEAKQSDKLRQSESRAKRLAASLQNNEDACHTPSQHVTDGHTVSHDVTPAVPSRAVPSRTVRKEPASRDSDALVSDFQAIIGSRYSWQGVKDGAALAKLRKAYDLEEIRKRWRKGLLASGYASCRTVAELAMKFNHLAGEAAPLQPKLRQL